MQGKFISLATLAAATAAAVLGAWPRDAGAHQSFAMYDQSQSKTLTGKLTRFIPGANHAQIVFELLEDDGTAVLGADGKPALWGVETGPAARIARQGVTPDNFPAGTIITVTLNRRPGSRKACRARSRGARSLRGSSDRCQAVRRTSTATGTNG